MTARDLAASTYWAVIDRPYSSASVPQWLEEVLQSKLHDPRIVRGRDLSEETAVEVDLRVLHVEGVGYVERFRTEFHTLHFTNLEAPGNGHIELPLPGPF